MIAIAVVFLCAIANQWHFDCDEFNLNAHPNTDLRSKDLLLKFFYRVACAVRDQEIFMENVMANIWILLFIVVMGSCCESKTDEERRAEDDEMFNRMMSTDNKEGGNYQN